MSLFALSALTRESGALNISIVNVPANAKSMRMLLVDNTASVNEMRKFTIPMPQGMATSVEYRIPSLTNGHAYDLRLSAYDANFNLIGTAVDLLDQIPADKPPAPSVVGIVNRDGYVYNIKFNCGADSGDPLKKLVVNIYDRVADVLRTDIFDIAGLVALDRTVNVSLPALSAGKTYNFTAYSMNAIGDSDLSSNQSLTMVDLPDAPTTVALTIADNTLRAEWAPRADIENFANVQYAVSYVLQWTDALLGAQENVFHTQNIAAIPFVNAPLPAAQFTTKYSTAVNFNTKSFGPTEIAALVSQLGLQEIRQLVVKCRVQTTAGSIQSADPRESAASISILNVSAAIASSVSALIAVSSNLTRASAASAASLALTASKSVTANTSLASIARVAPLSTTNLATWFDRVVVVGRYNQQSAVAPLTSIPTNLMVELLNSQTTANNAIALAGSVYRSSDNLQLSYYLQNGASGPKSGLFSLPAQSPALISLLDPSYESNGMTVPVCRNGQLYFKVKKLSGNAVSSYGVVNLKIDGQPSGTAFDSAPIAFVSALADEPNVFELSCGFGSIPQGSLVNVKITLFEMFEGNTVPVQFAARNLASDSVVYFDQNYTALLTQSATSVVSMVADLTADPQAVSDYALFFGFYKIAFAGAQGSNADLSVGPLAGDILMTLEAGANPKAVKFNLDASSATYSRYDAQGRLSELPVELRVAVPSCDRLVLTPSTDANLALVKNRSGFSGALSDYHWVKCVKSTLAPGPITFSTTASRLIGSVTYSSNGSLSDQIIDAASIPSTLKPVEAVKKAVAFPINFNGASSAEVLVTGIPIFDNANILNAVVTVRRQNVVAADLNANGYYLVRVPSDCSAFLIAMHTNSASGSSLVNVIQNADLSTDVKPNIPVVLAAAPPAPAPPAPV
jgi:hypothetical protein